MEEDRYRLLQKDLNDLKKKLEKIKIEKENIFAHLRENGSDLWLNIDYRKYLKKQRELEEKISVKKREKEAEVKKQLNVLMEKRRERKTLEKLKEKETEKFIKEFLLDEQKELDEIGRQFMSGGR
ncbi:flagellar FliJ protein [Halanaerobium sp. MA284_MarDTE_T2]|nr:flagellar FliJ protein [Halanaerobium sp. MA284_MarDTE_T2]RCW84665.1 flagellar FliJ protein [Halanaerobium sp. DL-01]